MTMYKSERKEQKELRLWEVEHDYYCNQGNYYKNDTIYEYSSWRDFMVEYHDADLDYNLIFRWDWEEEDDDGEPNFNGDTYYRNGTLKLFYMGQRKGKYWCVLVSVCRADEAEVRKFLNKCYDHLKKLWSPL